MLPLQVPGGMELLIILLLFVLPLVVIVGLLIILKRMLTGDNVDEERIDELESELEDLERTVERLQAERNDGE
ncbi:MAG: preprotein translocase subunit TatA [Halobacteriota archaeon]